MNASQAPIALLSDFGSHGTYPGSMKAAIMKIRPDVQLIDITHDIAAGDIAEAAFTLAAVREDYPPHTVFVCVVDPGVGSKRRGLATEIDSRVYVGPDNGIFSCLFAAGVPECSIELREKKYFANQVSSTFHGRDIFAPCAAHISLGVKLQKLGPRISDPVLLNLPTVKIGKNSITGELLRCDPFGNLISNIHISDYETLTGAACEKSGCEVRLASRRIPLVDHYLEGGSDLAALWGSSGYLEIAKPGGDASHEVSPHQEIILRLGAGE